MSSAVFPALPGITWDITKAPQWNTKVQRSDGGKELRAQFFTVPIWRWGLAYDVLRSDPTLHEYQTLVGFINQRAGMFDSFLYSDPSDNTVTAEPFGTGNGSTTAFQLQRALGGFEENVTDLNGTPSIFINGTLQVSGYTINATGLVTFSSAPAAAAALTWSGSYYWRVRFDIDNPEFTEVASGLWTLKKLSFVSVR